MSVRFKGASSGWEWVVLFIFAPTSVGARVTTVPWVTADSRWRRGVSRRAELFRAFPSTAITRRSPGAEADRGPAGVVAARCRSAR